MTHRAAWLALLALAGWPAPAAADDRPVVRVGSTNRVPERFRSLPALRMRVVEVTGSPTQHA